jgi:pimeloyl-ACP methyl ester carboxylesterase
MSFLDARFTRGRMIAGTAAGAALVAGAPATAQTATAAPIWSATYTATKGPVQLAVYRKRAGAPKPGERARPVLLLAHGSSVSALPTYDLVVPGAGEYSVMDVFARLGYDVWTVDFENYGRSSRTAGNSNIADGAADVVATTDLIARESGVTTVHLYGESSGALRVALFAAQNPARTGRVVLSAYTYTGAGSPTLTNRAKDLAYYQTHNRRPRDQSMIDSIFTRDKPGTSDPRVAVAIGAAELPFGNEVPTGSYLDMVSMLPIVQPAALTGPVLVMRGEFDGIASMEDLLAFYRALPSGDRQFVVLPGVAHSAVWAINRQLTWHAVHAFLSMPAAVPV